MSKELIFCHRFPERCLGNDTCSEGYTGFFCESCDAKNGFIKIGNTCGLCGSSPLNSWL